MESIKKITLYLFGILLVIFGNRELLAKINNTKDATKNIEPVKKNEVAKKDSVRTRAINDIETKNGIRKNSTNLASDNLDSAKIAGEKAQKSKVVVGGVEKVKHKKHQKSTSPEEKKITTTIEKEAPEKASSTK